MNYKTRQDMRGLRVNIMVTVLLFLSNAINYGQITFKKSLSEKKHKMVCATYSPDGKYVATGGIDRTVVIWDAGSGNIDRKIEDLKDFPIAMSFDQQAKYIAFGGKDRKVSVYDISTGSIKYTLTGYKGDIKTITFSFDNKYIASSGDDAVIKIWDMNTGSLVKDLEGHKDQVNSVDFNATGDKLVSGSADKTIAIWNVKTGSIEKQITAHTNWVRDVAYSPDQKYIASCGDDKIINIWDANNLELVNTFRAHKNIVMDISFSPDGNYLVSGGHDNRIVVFDLKNGSIVFQSSKQESYVLAVDFDPKGKDIVSVSLYSDELAVWDASSLHISSDVIDDVKAKAQAAPVVINPPNISWSTPSQAKIEIASTVTPVEATIQSEGELSSVEVYVNDRLFSTDSREDLLAKTQGNTTAFKRNVFLQQGENNIKLVAKNDGGSTNSEVKTVVYKLTQKPQISWITPNTGSVNISGSEYTISSTIASQSNLQKVELYINDQVVSTDLNLAVSEINNYSINFEKLLALNQGTSNIKIAATNSAGTTYSDPIEIHYSDQQKVVAPIDYHAPTNPYRFALIIGNEDYSSYQVGLESESDVDFAVNDAETFHKYAIQYLGVPEDQAILRTNARYIEMRRELKKISGVIEMTDGKAEIFFFYAGHGFPHEKTKEPYLVPVDGSGTDLEFSAIKLDDVYAVLTDFPSKRVTVFIDACFSGGGRNQGLVAARAVKVKPKEVQLQSKLVVYTASSGDETSLPYKEKEHGMFSYFLLQKIEESKGTVSYKELSDYLREQVGIKSYMVNSKKQEPQTNISPAVIDEWEEWKLR